MTTLTRSEIAPDAAQTMVAAALGHAREKGWDVAVAVVDPHGFLVAFGRTDHVAPAIGDFALDKAYTAAMLRKSTQSFGERMASSQTLGLGVAARPRLMTWGGGVAVFDGRACIAGIGVSGAQDFEDIECCQSAIDANGFKSG
ncbi:heme-binding protein [Planktomarina temperata]|jgi:uncharacterized protein GlcG (DUF336 family)|nr:heme-binding protein [Planktomarina temperata]|tara:strand:+ start:1199 stop:1627 length:429 start_codon:yes stop_codon:yes gene_type:complete